MEFDGLPSTIMHLPIVTLTVELFTPKSNQHIYERTQLHYVTNIR